MRTCRWVPSKPSLCFSLREAVKFGRMSKKQREKVEDEANYHKRRLSRLSDDLPTSPYHGAVGSPTNNNNNNTQHAFNEYVA